jgi:hypothetical protein
VNAHDQVRRAAPDPWDIGFGAVVLAAGVVALVIWFPLDITGGFIEPGISGKMQPGDAFFPVLLAGAMVFLSVVHLCVAFFGHAPTRAPNDGAGRLDAANIRFFILFHAIVLGAMAVMYWLGPLTVWLLGVAGFVDLGYRQLVGTVPYKLIGYVVGGFLMTTALITWAEGCLRRRTILTAVLVIAVMVLIFDVLLSDIQLPPNADY